MAKTNTLIDRINEVKIAGESFKNSNILKSKKMEIEKFRIPFDEVCQKVKILETIYTAITTIPNINIVNIRVNFESIRTSLIQLKRKVKLDEYDKDHVNTLKKEIEKTNNEIIRSWKDYIVDRTSAIDSVLISLNELISDMPEKQILSSKKMLFSTSSPGNPNAVEAIESYLNTANALLSKLNLKDSVVEFIKLLTSQKVVTLTDLNSEIYEWITANGFANKIKLEFRR